MFNPVFVFVFVFTSFPISQWGGVWLGRRGTLRTNNYILFAQLSPNAPWFSVPCNQIIPPDSNLSSPCSTDTYLVMVHLLFPPNPSSPAELALLEPILNSSNETFVQIWLPFCPLELYLNINLVCFKSESTWLPCANLNKLLNKNWGLTSKIDVKWFWLQNFCLLRALCHLRCQITGVTVVGNLIWGSASIEWSS